MIFESTEFLLILYSVIFVRGGAYNIMTKATASAAFNGTQEEPGNKRGRMYEVNLTWPRIPEQRFRNV